MASFSDYKIDAPKKWKDVVKHCKIMEFLRQDPGKQIISDFYSDFSSQNGTRFEAAFESAVGVLSQRIQAYWHRKIREKINPDVYKRFDNEIVKCLERSFELKETLEIVAACLFWVLHDQETG